MAGGYVAEKIGSARTASWALLLSGCCCLLSPLMFAAPYWLFLVYLFVWGLLVAPDSPQFSTLVARLAPLHLKGTALTIYNAIGFSITTVSIFVTDYILHSTSPISGSNAFIILSAGALFGLPFMLRLIRKG